MHSHRPGITAPQSWFDTQKGQRCQKITQLMVVIALVAVLLFHIYNHYLDTDQTPFQKNTANPLPFASHSGSNPDCNEFEYGC